MEASTTHKPILFTGFRACGVNGNGIHGEIQISSYADYAGGTRITVLGQSSIASTGDWSARLLMHEISHLFNLHEDTKHFDDKGSPDYDPSQAYRTICLMGRYRDEDEAKKGLLLCDYCKNIANHYKYMFYNH